MNNNFFVLCKKLGKICLAKNVHISLAESCTGGYVSKLITDVAGSSEWFNGSAVVYSNLGKTNVLNVDEQLIKQCGAVSEETAKAMARGALKNFQADLALSITGVAGPHGGTKEKPVGLVCFGLADHKNIESKTMHFAGGRDSIRTNATLFALEWMIMHLSITM